jgi:hypothetical protein
MNPFRQAAALLAVGALSAAANTYYVATNGNDGASGSFDQPWRTIQKAANTLAPGDTALVRSGVYSEAISVNVSGSAGGGYVTFQNYPGETPIVDGTGLTVPPASYAAGLFQLTDRSFIAIQGFEIRNYQTNSTSLVPAGIGITGGSHDILVLSNRVHDIANTNANGNAYGIEAHGTSASQAISNLVIRGNELYNLKTGWSESMVLNGNVTDFDVSGNIVHDNWNIGIDFIGYEGTCPDANLDRARRGVCRDNIIWNCSTFSNPSYHAFSCAGIYCDGSTEIVIERNRVSLCDIGMELASEHKNKATSFVTCRNNLIWSNAMGGIFVGGYSSGVGRTEYCTMTHNTLYHNDTNQWGTGDGEFVLQFDTRTNTFTHNILIVANWENNWLISNTFTQNSGNVVDWNLYYNASGTNVSHWQWKKTNYTSFAAYKTATGNDAHSLFVNPLFVNPSQTNFLLTVSSPAVDHGDPSFVAASGETDWNGDPRSFGGRTDLGADEHTPMDDWRMSKFTNTELLRPAISGNLATPAGDGIVNLLKYALVLEPKSNSPALLPAPQVLDGLLTLTYNRAVTATDVTCSVESAAEPGGPWTSNSVAQTALATNGACYTVRAQETGTNSFMRIRVLRP